MNNKKEKTRRLTIVCLLIIISLFSVGYAVLAQNLTINYSSNIDANWNIEIISIDSIEQKGLAENSFEPRVLSSTSASFGVNLKAPNDSMTYRIKIKNNGTIDAYLEDVLVSENSSTDSDSAIKYAIFKTSNNELSSKEVNEIDLKIYYDDMDEILPSEEKNYVVNFIYRQKKN